MKIDIWNKRENDREVEPMRGGTKQITVDRWNERENSQRNERDNDRKM